MHRRTRTESEESASGWAQATSQAISGDGREGLAQSGAARGSALARQELLQACWYALRTRPRHEKSAGRHLTGRRYETFIPTSEKTRRWSDRTRKMSVVLFPGYIFTRFLRRDFPIIRATPGVLYVAPVATGPVPIPEEEIENLRETLARGIQVEPVHKLMPGSLVAVWQGPLKGLTGRLVQQGRRSTLVVAINILQQGVQVEVKAEDVVPLQV